MMCSMALLAVLWLDIGADSDASALHLIPRWTDGQIAGMVRYRLDRRYADGSTTNGYFQSQSEFVIPLTGANPAVLYTVKAVVGANTYDGVNTIGLVRMTMPTDTRQRRLPVIFEQPGPETGTGIAVGTLLKCNRFGGGAVFWSLDSSSRPRGGWRVDAHGALTAMPRYVISKTGYRRQEESQDAERLPAGWMLSPDSKVSTAAYWLCGQYVAEGTTQTFYLNSTKSDPTWNPQGYVVCAVHLFEGLLPGEAIDADTTLLKKYGIDYVLPSGVKDYIKPSSTGKFLNLDLPVLPKSGGLSKRGFPIGTVMLCDPALTPFKLDGVGYARTSEPSYLSRTRICVSTAGPDRYADGTIVRDGERYALVKVPATAERIVFTEDGRLTDPSQQLVAVLPQAQNGRLPETIVEFDSTLWSSEITGSYVICLLDTRLSAERLAPSESGEGAPEFVRACGTAALKTTGQLPTAAVSTTANLAGFTSAAIDLRAAGWGSEPVVPRISTIAVSESNVLLTVEGMVPGGEYSVQPAATLSAFESPLSTRPQGKVFDLPKDPSARFFRVVRRDGVFPPRPSSE